MSPSLLQYLKALNRSEIVFFLEFIKKISIPVTKKKLSFESDFIF